MAEGDLVSWMTPQEVAPNQPLKAAVCIVGAGAAGITLACELDGSNLPVLLLEAGPLKPHNQPTHDSYEGTSEGVHPPPGYFRRQGFGGSTAIWGGRCIPFDPIDFEPRDHVPHSGWPIGYDEVARHYPAAMRYCDAGAFEFDARQAFTTQRETVPGLAHGEVNPDAIERYSLPTHFGARYGERLAASRNVRVLGDAHVVRLIKDPHADRIQALEFRLGPDGPLQRVEADRFVLATGGIEVPRLLLASDPTGVGLGNRSDCVGRFYACHVEGVVGVLRTQRHDVAFDFETTHDGIYARRKLLIDPTVQRRERLLNIGFRLHYPNVADPAHRSSVLSAVYLAKRMLIPEYRRILQHGTDDVPERVLLAHLRNIAFGLPSLASFSADWLRRRVLAERKLPYVLVANADGSHSVMFNTEQTPLHDSRITLGPERDALGVPRVHINWRFCEDDIDSICRAYRVLQAQVEAGGACTLDFGATPLREQVAKSIPVGGHHIGTTRMAAQASGGVVDRNCAVFDLPNLFIASASVFPTCSHANPTLTLVAMAVRLGAHLRQAQTVGVREGVPA